MCRTSSRMGRQKAGIIAGDKIVYVDGKKFVGKQVTNDEAMHRLKGPSGSKVKIGVVRYGHKGIITYTVTRAEIPEDHHGYLYARRQHGIY